MRIYWYEDGKMTRLRLTAIPLPDGRMMMDTSVALAESLGFPTLLDASVGMDEGEGIAVFGADDLDVVQVPGREDLEADTLVVWLRSTAIAGIFFTKALVDTAAVLAVITTYMQALIEINELGQQKVKRRVFRAKIVAPSPFGGHEETLGG